MTMRIFKQARAAAWTVLALALSQAALAGATVDISKVTDKNSLVPGELVNAMEYHVNGVSGATKVNPSSSSKLKNLAAKWRGATVARFEYSYKGGTRVYNAMSGQDTADLLYEANSAGHKAYPGFLRQSSVEKAATNVNVPNGKLSATIGQQATDAELKALKTFEKDILDGAVPRGGRMVGYISQAPCASCDNVIRQQLANQTDYVSDIKISYLPKAAEEAEGSAARELAHEFNGRRLQSLKDNVMSLRGNAAARLNVGGGTAGCL